jgi:CRP/FNR family transcriptional regulator, nitrogen fixation regulation protein
MLTVSSNALVGRAPVPFNKSSIPIDVALARSLDTTGTGSSPTAGHVLDSLAPTAATVQVNRGTEIIAQGDEAEYWFQVVHGCVRSVRLLEDGRRQVGEFLLPGDVFGWEALGEHEFAAEAVTQVTLRRFRLGAIEEHADRDRIFAHRLRRYIADQVRITRGRLVLLGRLTAAERIASFLLEMSERLNCPGKAVIELPMCRADMADYLCLTIETVSRGLTELRQLGAIAVERTRIVIHDRHALCLAGSDRFH